jgi:hypothetical protein
MLQSNIGFRKIKFYDVRKTELSDIASERKNIKRISVFIIDEEKDMVLF